MAVSAFKSSSRRGNNPNYTNNTISSSSSSSSSSSASVTSKKVGNGTGLDDVDKKVHRRSRSVSATSRLQNSNRFDDVVNTRDNPLFNSSPPDETKAKSMIRPTLDKLPSKMVDNAGDIRRGRSASRTGSGNVPAQSRKAMGQSLSRLDTGRRNRSVSRMRREDSESDIENKYSLSSPSKSKTFGKSVNVATSDLDKSSTTRHPHTWSSRHSVSEPPDYFRDDRASTSSFSEAEEKTILAFTEQIESFQSDLPEADVGNGGIYETVRSEVRRAINEIQGDLQNAIQRNNLTNLAKSDVTDISPEFVNPDAVELVSEFRSEYGAKLKQSQERARKLRADLAVEEHREQEFSRILEEIVPEPKNHQTQKSRPRRKTSIERRKMSKRLTEEALSYFDECVSISTFDGSDFSMEDPLPNLALTDPVIDDQTGSSASPSYYCRSPMNTTDKELDEKSQSITSHVDSGFLTSGNSKYLLKNEDKPTTDTMESPSRKFQFSLTREPVKADAIRHEMGNFGKMFEKDNKEKDSVATRSSYSDGYYCQIFQDERLLSERVVLRNLIESGSFILCDIWT